MCREIYAFTNENSWLMKFLKIVKKMKKCVSMREIYFQTIDENKQLLDEKDVCMQTVLSYFKCSFDERGEI